MATGVPVHDSTVHVDSQATLLRVENLGLDVRDGKGMRTLARGISFTLNPGTILPLSGPSGIGKSTLLRALIRLHPLTTGSVYYRGQSFTDLPAPSLRRSVGLFQQRPSFFGGTTRENLLEPFSFRNVRTQPPEEETLVRELEAVGLSRKQLDDRADTLSGGEGQRVALVRLLLLDPCVLLLDEPTANLDEESAGRIVQRVKTWVREAERAAIWIAHERAVIDQLGEAPVRFTREGLRFPDPPAGRETS